LANNPKSTKLISICSRVNNYKELQGIHIEGQNHCLVADSCVSGAAREADTAAEFWDCRTRIQQRKVRGPRR